MEQIEFRSFLAASENYSHSRKFKWPISRTKDNDLDLLVTSLVHDVPS